MQNDDKASSPYQGLTNLCYQLRHENSLLEEALRKKTDLLATYEVEITTLKRRLTESESRKTSQNELNLSERINIDNDRLRLMAEVSGLESRLRASESLTRQQEEELKFTRMELSLVKEELSKHMNLGN
jgi:chromosome segregation ATPase